MPERSVQVIELTWSETNKQTKVLSVGEGGGEEEDRGAPTTRPKSMSTVMAVGRITMKSLAKFGFCLAILLTSVAGKWLISTLIDLFIYFWECASCVCLKMCFSALVCIIFVSATDQTIIWSLFLIYLSHTVVCLPASFCVWSLCAPSVSLHRYLLSKPQSQTHPWLLFFLIILCTKAWKNTAKHTAVLVCQVVPPVQDFGLEARLLWDLEPW